MLEFIFKKQGDMLIVQMQGELDHHSSNSFRDTLEGMINKTNAKKLLLDFKGVPFMDSSGVGVIIGRYKSISRKGGQIWVTNLSPQVKKVMEISGLFKIIKLQKQIY